MGPLIRYFLSGSTGVLSSCGKSVTSWCVVCALLEISFLVSQGARLSVVIGISCNQYGYLCTYFAAVFQITLTVKLHWEIKSGEVSYPNLIKKTTGS